MADEIEASSAAAGQLRLFPEEAPTVPRSGPEGEARQPPATADVRRNHPGGNHPGPDSMPGCCSKQQAGRKHSGALIRAEQDRGPDFLRLSNALSALYPRGSEEKRLLDGMLLGSAEMNKARPLIKVRESARQEYPATTTRR